MCYIRKIIKNFARKTNMQVQIIANMWRIKAELFFKYITANDVILTFTFSLSSKLKQPQPCLNGS